MTGESIGRYRIVEPLGESQWVEAYKATDGEGGTLVTLKIFKPPVLADPERMRRLREDANAVAALRHACIAPVVEFGRDGEREYAVSEYVSGEPLTDVLARKRLRRRDAFRYALQVAEALHAAISVGVPHGALKPSNVLIDIHRRARLADFGFARL
ncbi:MAG: protein kinase domain-containing protein, partial [Bryobacteraceae bacterium]